MAWDYRGLLVYVESGPRNKGTPAEQWRVSSGPKMYDVDWIETNMFNGATKKTYQDAVDANIIYKGKIPS